MFSVTRSVGEIHIQHGWPIPGLSSWTSIHFLYLLSPFFGGRGWWFLWRMGLLCQKSIFPGYWVCANVGEFFEYVAKVRFFSKKEELRKHSASCSPGLQVHNKGIWKLISCHFMNKIWAKERTEKTKNDLYRRELQLINMGEVKWQFRCHYSTQEK